MRWTTILLLVVSFFSGALIGAGVTARAIQKAVEQRLKPSNWKPRTMDWLDKQLDLTPEQEAKIEPKVKTMVDQLVALQSDADAQRKQIIAELLIAINDDLTAEQQTTIREVIRKNAKGQNPLIHGRELGGGDAK